jgi:hypothetical protein
MSRRSLKAVYAVPALLAVVSLAGLVSALMGDDAFDWASWLSLGGLLAVIAWALGARRR